jgi:hypothetical protein
MAVPSHIEPPSTLPARGRVLSRPTSIGSARCQSFGRRGQPGHDQGHGEFSRPLDSRPAVYCPLLPAAQRVQSTWITGKTVAFQLRLIKTNKKTVVEDKRLPIAPSPPISRGRTRPFLKGGYCTKVRSKKTIVKCNVIHMLYFQLIIALHQFTTCRRKIEPVGGARKSAVRPGKPGVSLSVARRRAPYDLCGLRRQPIIELKPDAGVHTLR